MVMGDGLPSGRERAIETLIDMEPQGALYRAARVLVRETWYFFYVAFSSDENLTELHQGLDNILYLFLIANYDAFL
jgi:hypothetical protein